MNPRMPTRVGIVPAQKTAGLSVPQLALGAAQYLQLGTRVCSDLGTWTGPIKPEHALGTKLHFLCRSWRQLRRRRAVRLLSRRSRSNLRPCSCTHMFPRRGQRGGRTCRWRRRRGRHSRLCRCFTGSPLLCRRWAGVARLLHSRGSDDWAPPAEQDLGMLGGEGGHAFGGWLLVCLGRVMWQGKPTSPWLRGLVRPDHFRGAPLLCGTLWQRERDQVRPAVLHVQKPLASAAAFFARGGWQACPTLPWATGAVDLPRPQGATGRRGKRI